MACSKLWLNCVHRYVQPIVINAKRYLPEGPPSAEESEEEIRDHHVPTGAQGALGRSESDEGNWNPWLKVVSPVRFLSIAPIEQHACTDLHDHD